MKLWRCHRFASYCGLFGLVADPVAFSFDEWGRLYVIEIRDYLECVPNG
ncbi:MAG: hypothetical protein M2R45_04282 [Verrucomicrobia subdivision 3 bacterium]|nr:hypothetical protein [Limisphaerales bacterium]MCS1417389.1 hypothetical protein [Limisphaerales bacterium]